MLFLKWWLITTLMITGLFFAYQFNAFQIMWEADTTKLSFGIIAILGFMTIWCGIKTWNFCLVYDDCFEGDISAKFERLEEVGWFASDLCLTLGMIGTVFGFIMMLVGFANLDVENIKSIQQMMTTMGAGMSTALYTTLVGLIASALLKIQYFNLGQAITHHRKASSYKI